MTFYLDLWLIDLTINGNHLLIKDYLTTKFEASGAKHCWVICCTRFGRLTWPLTLTFDLLTWLSIGIIKDYLPIKFEASGAKHCWVISCTRFERLTWPLTLIFDLLTWLSIGIIYSPRTTYEVWSFWGKAFWSYQLHKVKGYRHTDRPTYRPTDRHTDRHVQRNMPLLLRRGA